MDLPVALGVAITFAVSSVGTFDPRGIFGREVYFDSLTGDLHADVFCLLDFRHGVQHPHRLAGGFSPGR